MKEIVSVRSNAFYVQVEDGHEFNLMPSLELIMIYTDGKTYKANGNTVDPEDKFTETRFIASPKMLSILITELQLQQQKLECVRKNADQLNALVKHISTPIEP